MLRQVDEYDLRADLCTGLDRDVLGRVAQQRVPRSQLQRLAIGLKRTQLALIVAKTRVQGHRRSRLRIEQVRHERLQSRRRLDEQQLRFPLQDGPLDQPGGCR
jgi:hypothetical protein